MRQSETKTHIWFLSACLEFFFLLGSDYLPGPHAGLAGEQIKYAAQHSALPVQLEGRKLTRT